MSVKHKCLVVGSGSIARRHIKNLRELLPSAEVACVSATGRTLAEDETAATVLPKSLADAIAWEPTLAVVASPAPMHLEQTETLLQANIPVLIEKPLSDSLDSYKGHAQLLNRYKNRVEVAYNLRYLTSSKHMKTLIDQNFLGRLHTITIDIGQYLPNWRPGTDYRINVSAKKSLGGGVLLELSHEFDYLTWIFGKFNSLYCLVSNSGQLSIDVEDRADIILSREDGLVAHLHLDFLQRKATRFCKVIGERGNLIWDLITNSIVFQHEDGEDVVFSDHMADRNTMYLEQMQRFITMAEGTTLPQIPIEEALYVLKLIDAMRAASRTQLPISLTGI